MVELMKKIDLPKPPSPESKAASEKPKRKLRLNLAFLKEKKLKYVFIALAVFFGIFLLLAIPTWILAGPFLTSARKTYSLAQEAYEAGKNQDLVTASEKLKETEDSLKETQKRYNKMTWLKFTPMATSYYKDGQRALNASLYGLQAGRTLVDAITPYADILGFKGQGSFMGGTAEDRIVKIVQTLEKVTPEFDKVAEKLILAQEELDQIDPKRYPKTFRGKPVRAKIAEIKTLVSEAILGVTEAKPIISVFPKILGYPDSKKYLVIFQNDGELRGTGGFMTAFAVLHVESGKIKAEKSDDTHSLDKKFRSTLPAPEPIAKYLFGGEYATLKPYYYLRDMNFSPDFKVAMDTFNEHYDGLPGEYKVDGIIAMDTDVLTDLIGVLGPIEVAGYGTFTTEPDERCHNLANVICEIEHIVDIPLPTQVSNRKKTILGPMMQQIMLKSLGSAKNLWPNLFGTGLTLLKEKHMLMYFTDEEIQQAVEAFGAGGRIKSFEGDYLHVNDSNFGGAKSNFFTNHSVEQEIEIDEDGTVQKTLTLVYENSEPVDNCNLERATGLCLNSTLRNYLRVYVPKGSRLQEAVGTEEDMETKEELGKTYFDGFFTVKGDGGRAKVVIKYELPFKQDLDKPYKLFIQKQGGTLNHKYKVIFGDQEKEFELRTDQELEFKI